MTSPLRRARRAVLTALPLSVRRSYFFWRAHSKLPKLRNPATFSEKVTWRIIYDRRNLLSWTCDKYEMKHRVKELDPSVNVVPTLWYGRDVSTIPFDELPEEWVIKPNRQHSGRVHFHTGGEPSVVQLRHTVEDWLRDEQAEIDRAGQWAYSQAKSGVLIEPRIYGPANNEPPIDYKVFVFGGKAQLIQVHVGRGENHRQYHMTPDWRETNITTALSGADTPPTRPASLETIVSQAENIAEDFDFLRVDFYEQDGIPFFGEVTPYPAGGLRKFSPASVDQELGAMWTLPPASSGRQSVTFEWATGQDDNIGDSLLRRPSLIDARARGSEMHVYHGQLSSTFETAFGLDEQDVSYTSFRKWFFAAVASGLRRPTLLVPNPGEMKVTRGGAARLAAIWIASLAPKARIIWMGAAVPEGRAIWSLPYRAVAKRAKLAAFRDAETVRLLGAGIVSPDWAFSLGSDIASWPRPESRSRLAVLLRGARPVPSDEWIAWLKAIADEFALRLTFISQVRRDNDLADQLAERMGGESICFPEGTDHADQEKLVREVYKETRIAVSDRLHGLIVAATEGAVPLGWIPSSNGKIARHFNAVDMPFVGRLEGVPAEELPPVDRDTLAQWEASLPVRIADARRRVTDTLKSADAVAPRSGLSRSAGSLK